VSCLVAETYGLELNEVGYMSGASRCLWPCVNDSVCNICVQTGHDTILQMQRLESRRLFGKGQ
jgi:hypothetical protein